MHWLKVLRAVAVTAIAAATVGAGAMALAAGSSTTVTVSDNATLGNILVGPNGNTLYMFKKDTSGVSNCSGGCAALWPPLTVTGTPTAGAGATGTLATITRSDGSTQVTYNGWPLYYFTGDTAAGETNGQGFKSIWYAATPTMAAAPMAATPPPAETVNTIMNATYGPILTDAAGMTLYWHSNDPVDGSVCTGSCATYWPPATVTGTPTQAPGVTGKVTTFTDPGGQTQVAYNGHALYAFAGDTKSGDVNGDLKNGFGGIWHVATVNTLPATVTSTSTTTPAPAPAPAPAPGATVNASGNATYGTILTNAAGMTLYYHSNDPANASVCTGTCATYWPPATATGTPTAGVGVTGKLTTFTNPEGQTQIAYNGHALYTFAADTKAGDVNGDLKNGFGGIWHVATVSTAAATTSPALPTTGGNPLDAAAGAMLLLVGAALLVRRPRAPRRQH